MQLRPPLRLHALFFRTQVEAHGLRERRSGWLLGTASASTLLRSVLSRRLSWPRSSSTSPSQRSQWAAAVARGLHGYWRTVMGGLSDPLFCWKWSGNRISHIDLVRGM
mmetsp:Transcript_107861/g.311676  ORF Transcript_107861/g.311676 Transcript_107861/m.311676 type:complete len:108 (-) Transcript_107861:115-438(-)